MLPCDDNKIAGFPRFHRLSCNAIGYDALTDHLLTPISRIQRSMIERVEVIRLFELRSNSLERLLPTVWHVLGKSKLRRLGEVKHQVGSLARLILENYFDTLSG